MLLIILVVIVFVLFLPTIWASIIGAPLVLTPKQGLKEAIKKAAIKPGDTFYELGAGTGRVMTEVAKQTGTPVVGFELSPIFFMLCWLNLKINRIKNSKLFLQDFFKADLREADVIFCFLTPKSMEKLKPKFKKELKKSARIISFCFPVPDWQPYAVVRNKRKLSFYLYKV